METSLAERVYELRRNRRHGASWMARRAIETLVELAGTEAAGSDELFERLLAAGRELAVSRPEVGAIAGAVGRLMSAVKGWRHLEPVEFRRLVEEEAHALLAARDRAAASIAIQLRERLVDAFVLTHSASATVREALLHTAPERVTCTVSAPNEEGRAFAEELRQEGLNAELVDDDQAAGALAHASLLLLGADTIFRDGSLCNKIGTAGLAREASEQGVPTVVACEVIKLAPVDAPEAAALDSEVASYFDYTPPEDVDLIVTEEGSFGSDEVRPLIDRTPFLAEGYALLRGR